MDYVLENISETSIEKFKQCFDANDSLKELENIRWQFLDCPVKKRFVDIAIDREKDKVAAIYAIFPVVFKINQQEYIAAQSLDTITDIDYRGKGLFVHLAKDVYSKALNDDVVFVYGFPNGNSIHGFIKKLEWTTLDPVPFLIKPLKSRYFTSRIPFLKFLPNINLSFSRRRNQKNFTIKAERNFTAAVDSVWKIFSANIKVGIMRDEAYLNWRYVQKPNEDYVILNCYDSSNVLKGFIIFTSKNKHGGKIGYVMELIYDLDFPKIGQSLLKEAIGHMKKEGCDCVLSWCFEHSPNYDAFHKELFFKMPQKLRPIELHFGVRSFNQGLNAIISERKNWYISYSDSDTV